MPNLENSIPDPTERINPLQRGKELSFPNDVSVVTIGVKHSKANWNAHEEEIKEAITSADFVVSESPPNQVGDSFYGELLQSTLELQKSVLYVDPLTPELATVDLLQFPAGALIALAGVGSMAYDLHKRGNKVSRRHLGMLGVAFAGAVISGTSIYGQSLIATEDGLMPGSDRPNPVENNRFTLMGFRNAGAIVGLHQAAQDGIVNGRGLFVVGRAHLGAYEYYANHIPDAVDTFKENIRPHDSEGYFGPAPIQLWMPDQHMSTYHLAVEAPRNI